MSDWLPDWKDKSQYPNPDKTSAEQWAWEFLRRNSKYKNFWELLSEKYKKSPDLLRRAKNLSAIRQSDGTMRFKHPNKKLDDLCDAANSFNYFFGITTFPANPSENNPALEFEKQRFLIKPPEKKIYKAETFISGEEIAYVFNMELPIEDQISSAKKLLKQEKKNREIAEFRIRAEKYPLYLRILDAKAKYKKNTVIAQVLFPWMENEYPYYRGNRKVQESLEAAEKLRDKDYILLGAKQK